MQFIQKEINTTPIQITCHLETNNKEKQARKFYHQKHIPIKPESRYVCNANQPISNDHRTFLSPYKHINTTHFTIHTCLMMGEASLQTSPKNNMIQDMINSDNKSLYSWCIASLYIYHFLTVIDFSSEKYSRSTGHRNSWY